MLSNVMAKSVVVYYSKSNKTEQVAKQIQKLTNSDLIKLELQDANYYADDYKSTTEKAKKEIADGVKPAIKTIKSITEYDTIYIGSPVWYGTFATPVSTFLSQNDLSNKKVVIFMTHGGGGVGQTENEFKKISPKANLIAIKGFGGYIFKDGEKDIEKWVNSIKK
jgi:flavodoxin